jgi:molybdopterin-guanine dinucleotide biosynthesis protein
MAIIVVGGSGRNVGKTSLICGLIAATPELPWTAVKITSHAYGHLEPLWEETTPGQGTDTSRYLAAGARRAFLMTAEQSELPIEVLATVLRSEANVIFESNRIIDQEEADLHIGVIGRLPAEAKPSFESFLRRADAFAIAADQPIDGLQLPQSAKLFRLPILGCVSVEMLDWLRTRLVAWRTED